MRQRSRYIVMRRRRSRWKWTRRTWRRHRRTRRRTWRSFLRPAFITTADAVWIDFWRYVYYVPPGLREVVVAVMLSFVRDKIRHAFRIQFRIHAEKLPAQATAPFFEHAVMPVGRLGPFAVATAVRVYSMIFCLVRIYPDVLCVTRIKLGERLQLVDRLAEKLDCVFIVPEITMRYFKRLFVIERYGRYLKENVLPSKIVMFRSAVEVRQCHLIPRLHEAVFYFRDLSRFLYVRIGVRAVSMPARRERERQRIKSKDIRMHVHAFIYFGLNYLVRVNNKRLSKETQ